MFFSMHLCICNLISLEKFDLGVHFESVTLPPHKYIDRSQRTQLNTVDICLVAVEFITKSDVVSMAR